MTSTTWVSRALLACLLCTLALPAAARAHRGHTQPELRMVKAINDMRAAQGLSQLKPNRSLANAAGDHSGDMANNNFFAHNSFNGTDPFNRVRGYIRKNLMGETLAYMPVQGNTRPRHILKLWMNSPGHRATLTTRAFRRIGIGRTKGWLGGDKVVFWTADLTSAR